MRDLREPYLLAWLTPLLVDQDACFAWMERITLATSYEALRASA